MAFVDQSNINALFPQSSDGIQTSVQSIRIGDDVSSAALQDDIVFPRLKFVPITKERLTTIIKDFGNFRSCTVHKTQSFVPKNCVYHFAHLMSICGEEEMGLRPRLISQTTVGEKIVMSKMAEYIATIQPRHGDLTENHFLKCSKSSKNTLSVIVKGEASACTEISPLHDTTVPVDLWASLSNLVETARPFQIAVHHQNPSSALLLRRYPC